jgi:hypothetical protein
MFAAALTRHAPATPGRTALVGHWRKNKQTGRLEWRWSLEPVSDDPEATQCPRRGRHHPTDVPGDPAAHHGAEATARPA